MTREDHSETESLLALAHKGDGDALGRLLEGFRSYLWLLARAQLHGALKGQLNPSDVVQEVSFEACRDFKDFRGSTEKELVFWLRKIFVRNLADQLKRLQAVKRGPTRQESIESVLERSSLAAEKALASGLITPSAELARREVAVMVANAVASLPESYREVVVLRHFERLKFEEISERLGRSSGAVRMLWARALEKLRASLEGYR